jgi:hypothetical protein
MFVKYLWWAAFVCFWVMLWADSKIVIPRHRDDRAAKDDQPPGDFGGQ